MRRFTWALFLIITLWTDLTPQVLNAQPTECREDRDCESLAYLCVDKRCRLDPHAEERALDTLLTGMDAAVARPCLALRTIERALLIAQDANLKARAEFIQQRIDQTRDACATGGFGLLESQRTDRQGVEAVLVSGGHFRRGADRASLQRGLAICRETYSHPEDCNIAWFEREGPRRDIDLSPFYVDRTETTNAHYSACVVEGACTPVTYEQCNIYNPDTGTWSEGGPGPDALRAPDHPVVCVTWAQAREYCAWAGKRLPTEAEWEKAARGDTDDREFPWGSQWHADWLNWGELDGFGTQDGYETSAPVASFPKNVSPYGAFDMAGNVWEWTRDWQDDTFYRRAAPRNPINGQSSTNRIVRGGSWSFAGNGARTSYRYFESPSARDDALGFRCVQDP